MLEFWVHEAKHAGNLMNVTYIKHKALDILNRRLRAFALPPCVL